MGFYGSIGFVGGVSLINCTVTNSHFTHGLAYMDEGTSAAILTLENSTFVNNTSEYGTIMNVKHMDINTACRMRSTNSTFIGNRASKYGGIIYSMGLYNHLYFNFTNNTYIDNHAKLGDIMYSYSKATTPQIDNLEELETIENAIVTNPTKLILSENSIKNFSIYSGDTIPNNITSK